MLDEDEQLRSIAARRTKRKPVTAARLSDILMGLMDNRISPKQARFGPVAELWDQLLPEELHRHCRIADISNGQLKVLVDSPSYLHELRLCSLELLERLQRQCPRARIKKIKCLIG